MRKPGRPSKKLDRYPNRIREVREALGVTLQELARRIGANYQTIQQYELGRSDVGLRQLERIAKALGVSAIALVNSPQPKEPAHAPPQPF